MFTKIYEKVKLFIVENYKFLLMLVAIILIFKIELPYVIYKPGGSINLNDRIEIEDGYESKGSFEMAYVSLVKGNLPFLLVAKIIPNWDIIPKDNIINDDESLKDALEKDKLYLEEAIDNATIAAYNLANKEIKITNTINNVIYIVDEAKTSLEEYDEIVSVDGKSISSLNDLKNIIKIKEENDIVDLKVLRNNKEINATAKVYQTDDGLKIGISILNTYDLETSPDIKVKTKSSESGPSGGLMMALSIYNSLVKEDITKGRKIIGTGTITKEGKVGEIGGVKYKLMGAVKKDADIFMCPKENYEEALEVAKDYDYDIKIVSISSLENAVNYLLK